MFTKFKFYTVIFMLSCQLWSVPTYADADKNNCETLALPTSLSEPVIASNGQLEVGDVIPGSGRYINLTVTCNGQSNAHVSCNDSATNSWTIGGVSGFQEVTGFPSTFTYSSLPSWIGLQFLDSSGDLLPASTSGNRVDTLIKPLQGGLGNTQDVPVRLQFVKIDEMPSGTNSTTATLQFSCEDREWMNLTRANSQLDLNPTIEILSETCYMVDKNVTVNLDSVTANNFSGVGTTAASQAFTLDFNCDENANAFAYFSDSTDSGNDSDILTLDSTSTAAGIGIQLSKSDGSTIVYSPFKIFDSSTSSILSLDNSGTNTQQRFSFAMQASYIQTEDTITSGTVKALAEVNIAYQ